jgi:hypothetical protein
MSEFRIFARRWLAILNGHGKRIKKLVLTPNQMPDRVVLDL